ncbi:MAG: caspase family protein [Planctomycetaceae bacterium]
MADTDDVQIGDDVGIDIITLGNAFRDNIPKSQRDIRIMVGKEVTRDLILQAIRKISPGPDDAVVFAYAGHGLFDKGMVQGRQKGQALQLHHPGARPSMVTVSVAEKMAPVKIDASKLLYRSEILAELNRKPCRLKVVWTDCCTTFVRIKSMVNREMMQSAPSMDVGPPPAIPLQPLFDQLFFKERGVVDLGSSAPGEMAYGDGRDGGYGTLVLCQYLTSNRTQRMKWNQVFDQVKGRLAAHFKQKYPTGADRASFGLAKQQTQTLHRFSVAPKPVQPPPPRGIRFGITVAEDSQGRGLTITAVAPNTPTQKIPARQVNAVVNGQAVVGELNVGDIITHINGAAVRTNASFNQAVDRSGKRMSFRILNSSGGYAPLDCTVDLSY